MMTLGGTRPLTRQRRWIFGERYGVKGSEEQERKNAKRKARAREPVNRKETRGQNRVACVFEPSRNKTRGQMIPLWLASVGAVASGETKKAQCRKQKKDQGSKPPAATVQAAATVNQVQSCPSDEDSFWIFVVSPPSGRNERILVDTSADDHVCPTNFASAAPLGLAKGGMLHAAQGHMIEAHGTRTVYMWLGLGGQSVGAEFRVTNVITPILSMGKLVKQGNRFEAGPTGCKMSKGGRSVTLDVVKNSPRMRMDAKAYTTIEWAHSADARLVVLVVDGQPEETSTAV